MKKNLLTFKNNLVGLIIILFSWPNLDIIVRRKDENFCVY